jgi:excisionase family DNA binding protein
MVKEKKPIPNPEKNAYTSQELANRLNVSRKTIETWRRTNRIPGSFRAGRAWRFSKSDIEEAILRGTVLLANE